MLITLTALAVTAAIAFLALRWGRFAVTDTAGSVHPMVAPVRDHVVSERVTEAPEVRLDYRSIVVGIDGTEHSKHAVEVAARLARDLRAGLTVIGSYDGEAAEGLGLFTDMLKGDRFAVGPTAVVDEMLDRATEHARAQGVDRVTRHSRSGAPVDVLLASAAESGADLIVVGADVHGTRWPRLFGTYSAETVRRSKTDVLIVGKAGPSTRIAGCHKLG